MSFCRHERKGIVYYTSSLLDSFGIPHLFAARGGGVSGGAFSSLNISQNRRDADGKTDTPENVAENYRRALAILNRTPDRAAAMTQIHSDFVMRAERSLGESVSENRFPECDGLWTKRGEEIDTLCVKTADCVPILLYDTEYHFAAALHAGWRGTVGGIAEKAVSVLRRNGARGRILAAVGPRIGACCYEVNRTVYDACAALSEAERAVCFPKRYEKDGETKYRADLGELNRFFLRRAGLCDGDIDILPLCTGCRPDEFFSHRASHGHSGTQISAIGCGRVCSEPLSLSD